MFLIWFNEIFMIMTARVRYFFKLKNVQLDIFLIVNNIDNKMAINFKFVNSPMINNNGGIKHVCNKEIIFNIWCFGIYSPMVHSNTLINYILHVIPADV